MCLLRRRLVYIRGTPEQTVSALRIIRHKVGGRRYVEDELVVSNPNTDGLQVPIEAFIFIFAPFVDPKLSKANDDWSSSPAPEAVQEVPDQLLSTKFSQSTMTTTSTDDSENEFAHDDDNDTNKQLQQQQHLYSSLVSVSIAGSCVVVAVSYAVLYYWVCCFRVYDR